MAFWIAGFHDDLANQWKWRGPQNDFPINSFDWNPGQPDNADQDCMKLFEARDNYRWDDSTCAISREFLCEKRVTILS